MILLNNQQAYDFNPNQNQANFEQLKNIRILQRNSIHLIGIPNEIASESILKKKQFFGQYGQIKRLSIRRVSPDIQNQKKGFLSVYVTFSCVNEASIAILCLNGFSINKKQLKVSYGLTRYCSKFLQGLRCLKNECDYKHQLVNFSECCSSQNTNSNKNIKIFKNNDIFQQLISNKFDFQKFFKKYYNMSKIDEKKYFLPQKSVLWKKYLKFIQKSNHHLIKDQSFKMQQLQKLNSETKNLQKTQIQKKEQDQVVRINSKVKFYSPQSSIKVKKDFKKLKSQLTSETNQEIQYSHYLYLSKNKQWVSSKKFLKKKTKQLKKQYKNLQQPRDKITNNIQNNWIINYKNFDPQKYSGQAPVIDNCLFDLKNQQQLTIVKAVL